MHDASDKAPALSVSRSLLRWTNRRTAQPQEECSNQQQPCEGHDGARDALAGARVGNMRYARGDGWYLQGDVAVAARSSGVRDQEYGGSHQQERSACGQNVSP